MGIFQKKFYIKDTPLRVVFDVQEKKYKCYYGNNLIPYNNLNRNSKKLIDSKNKELLTNPYILAQELERAKTIERFNKLKSLGYSCDSFEYLGAPNGTMSEQIEELLNSLTTEDNVLLGIHRIGTNDSPEKLEDILTNGLEITGHLGGAAQSNKELKNNVSYYPNNKTIIKELMYADKYKNSKGSILIRIPDIDLTQDIFIIDSQGRTRLNPKYIVGYVPLEENHHIETIIKPNQIRNKSSQHNYTFQNRTQEEQYYQEQSEHKRR